MKQRLIDFKNVLCAVPDQDFNDSTDSELTTWFSAWGTYVKTGGDRPPINPHHP
jgi:hypothetical protein